MKNWIDKWFWSSLLGGLFICVVALSNLILSGDTGILDHFLEILILPFLFSTLFALIAIICTEKG
jgi:hypothetical protein